MMVISFTLLLIDRCPPFRQAFGRVVTASHGLHEIALPDARYYLSCRYHVSL